MLASFRNNLIISLYQTLLNIKKNFRGNPFVLNHDWGKLWYSGDGDRQELLYHIKGSKWYQQEHKKLAKLVSPGSTVVDVGANMGFMALIFSRLTGKNGKVISLEPSHTTYKKLKKNLEENRLFNVISKNIGCASNAMVAELRKLSGSSGHSSLAVPADKAPNCKAEKVSVDTLDNILKPYGKVDFLKIDTEGFECEVLEGAKKILKESRPIIYIELSAQYKKSSERSIEILKEAGYIFLSEPKFSGNHSGDNFIAVPAENFRK